ncbi:SLAM family member 9-like, partial [Astyanax mexicanus]
FFTNHLQIIGSSDVFRVVGDSVQLEINGSVSEFDEFFWVFSGSVPVLKYYKQYKDFKPSPRYKDRVEFIEETCSLTLKNLQKTDNGLYEVKASNTEKTTTLCAHRLPVLGNYNRADPCDITLTCRGHDLSINSTCYKKKTCEEKEVTSPGGVALSLSVWDSIIICNHSNSASWKQENIIIALTHLCADIGYALCFSLVSVFHFILFIHCASQFFSVFRQKGNVCQGCQKIILNLQIFSCISATHLPYCFLCIFCYKL